MVGDPEFNDIRNTYNSLIRLLLTCACILLTTSHVSTFPQYRF